MVNLGVIGYGYWGPNLVRNFFKSRDCNVVALADSDPSRLAQAKGLHPTLDLLEDGFELISDDRIDAVAIATPVCTHFKLAHAALLAGKHVLVEKPLTRSVAEAEELVRVARLAGKTLMVDHTFIYTGAVRKLREVISQGQLGEVLYYDSVRVNLGLFQNDLNVLWDLAPHDFSIMFHLIRKRPVWMSAVGSAPISCDEWRRESVAYVTLQFEDGSLAHFHLNWLSPVKVRRTLIGGSRKMVVYDGLDADNQVKIYDKGVQLEDRANRYKSLVQYRTGDLLAPKVDQTEALEGVCQEFIDCIRTGRRPLTDGRAGLQVVRLLEAAEQSMQTRSSVPLDGVQPDLDTLHRSTVKTNLGEQPIVGAG